ncbi:MFS transporter [Candidatus Woesearchaeota archaeon]|nr:MFS transporter [Candidatus Woesearchaeota archaeon]
MNKNMRLFILSEFLVVSGFGFIFPIFAVFVKDKLAGGSILTVGIATTIYLLGKSLLRIPISKYCDKKKLHKEFMVVGYFLMSLVPLGYFLINSIYQLFLVEFFFAVSAAIGRSGWYYLFTKSLPKEKEGSGWSTLKGYTGVGDAIAATIGGVLVTIFGFNTTFVIIGIMGLIATFILSKVNVK